MASGLLSDTTENIDPSTRWATIGQRAEWIFSRKEWPSGCSPTLRLDCGEALAAVPLGLLLDTRWVRRQTVLQPAHLPQKRMQAISMRVHKL